MITIAPDEAITDITKEARALRSLWVLVAIGLVCLSLTFALYGWVREWQEERVSVELEKSSNAYRVLFQEKIDSYIAHLDSVRRFFGGSDDVNSIEFSKFVSPVVDAESAIEFFFWVPLATRQAETLPGREEQTGGQKAGGGFDPATSRFPITYAEPFPAVWTGMGFDLLEEPACTDFLRDSAEKGRAGIDMRECAPRAFAELDEHAGEHAFIIQPVYDSNSHQASFDTHDRTRMLRGFIILAFDIGESYEDSIVGTISSGIDVEIVDQGTGGEAKRLYWHASRSGRGEAGLHESYLAYLATRKSIPLDIPSADWAMVFTPISQFYARHYKWHAEFAAALGLLLTLGILISTMAYRRRYLGVKKVAHDTTRNLKAAQLEHISMLESISDIFFSVDSQWNLLYANPKAEKLIGQSNEQLHGRNLWEECPELASHFFRPLYKAMKEQRSFVMDGLPYPPQGKWFSVRSYPDGGGLSVYMMDVTQKEQEGRAHKKAERRTRAVLQTAVDGILTINQNGTVQSLNPAAERMFGYPEGDVIGHNIKMLMPEPYQGEHDGYLRNYLRSGKAKIIGIGREVVGLRRNGEEFPMHLSVSQFEFGDMVNFAGIVRDISDQKAAMQEIIEAREVAELANMAKSSFLDSMSHELRTPLNAVIGFSQLLAMDTDRSLTEKQKEYIGDITRSGELLLQLVSQVLDLSTIESGKLDVDIKDINVDVAIRECLAIINGVAKERNVTIVNLATGSEPLVIRTDMVRLKQVMLNLLSNAVKYNKVGGSVTVDVKKIDDDFLRISVTDTGSGLSLNEQERVFDAFDRLGREALSIEGTGIGLTIAQNIIHILGGRIGVTSKLDEGSTFWIDLPT